MIHACPAPARVLEPAQAAREPPAARPRSGCTSRAALTWAWSIVALTVIVRILLVPVTVKQIHSMQNLQAHAPEMKALQQKWKHDKQRQNEELMKFYRENKINPAASCLPMVLQIPIFISLFYVLRHFDERVLPDYVGSSVDWLHLVDITEPVKDGWGPLLLVIYVASQLSSSYFMSSTMQGAQRILLMVLPVAVRPVHHQLPGRPDALLADDEPVDDRPGARHPPADAEARAAREAELSHAREGRATTAARIRERLRRTAPRPQRCLPASRSPARRAASSARRAAEGRSGDRDHRRGDGRDGRRGEVDGTAGAAAPGSGPRPRRDPLPGVSEGERGLLGVGYTPASVDRHGRGARPTRRARRATTTRRARPASSVSCSSGRSPRAACPRRCTSTRAARSSSRRSSAPTSAS